MVRGPQRPAGCIIQTPFPSAGAADRGLLHPARKDEAIGAATRPTRAGHRGIAGKVRQPPRFRSCPLDRVGSQPGISCRPILDDRRHRGRHRLGKPNHLDLPCAERLFEDLDHPRVELNARLLA